VAQVVESAFQLQGSEFILSPPKGKGGGGERRGKRRRRKRKKENVKRKKVKTFSDKT
jgi:hypothetical protein